MISSSSFSTSLNNNLKNTNDMWTQSSSVIGSELSRAEQNMIEAFSLDQTNKNVDISSNSALKKLAESVGLTPDKNGKYSIEGIQMAAKSRYEKIMRAYSMFTQVLSNMHQTLMNTISQIRVR